ncbi:hypothetical protein DPMN_083965 [Dreissena polymorpha]|uniref:Uncharacterized protein n=1 Tax=Dreissena polymorpha TaxID=45954 RepID=A0A9D3YAA2_DREPO|nr:hypothetical protein DPMN_083965 [Dreissena polymorpha]
MFLILRWSCVGGGEPEYPEKTPPVRYGDHQPNSHAPVTGIEPLVALVHGSESADKKQVI